MGVGRKTKITKLLSPPNPPSTAEDDNELVDDLLAQLDARDQQEIAQVTQEVLANQDTKTRSTKVKKDSRSRFKERELRKAASHLAEQLPVNEAENERIKLETEAEEKQIRLLCDQQGLQIHEIAPDGHCLFAAVADQLTMLSILPAEIAAYHNTRQAAADYIATHPDDFLPFLVGVNEDDDVKRDSNEPMTQKGLEAYCATIRSTGAWGGEPEILALARAYNVSIHIFQGGSPSVVVHHPHSAEMDDHDISKPVVRLSYHRYMYGLGEHYNSLRPKI